MKRLIFRVGDSAGFFSEYNNMLLAYHYCLVNDIEFILDSKDANFASSDGGGWTDYFMPFCKEYKIPFSRHFNSRVRKRLYLGWHLDWLLKGVAIRLYAQIIKLIAGDYYTYDLFRIIREKQSLSKIYSIPRLGLNGTLLENCQVLHKMIWKYNVATQQEIDELSSKISIDSSYVGFHIRWGDKRSETELIKIESYVNTAKSILPNINKFFIATDDYTAVEDIRASYPHMHIETLCDPVNRGYVQSEYEKKSKNSKRRDLIELFASMDILMEADLFIGTYSSNLGANMGFRMPAHKIIGLDYSEWLIW